MRLLTTSSSFEDATWRDYAHKIYLDDRTAPITIERHPVKYSITELQPASASLISLPARRSIYTCTLWLVKIFPIPLPFPVIPSRRYILDGTQSPKPSVTAAGGAKRPPFSFNAPQPPTPLGESESSLTNQRRQPHALPA